MVVEWCNHKDGHDGSWLYIGAAAGWQGESFVLEQDTEVILKDEGKRHPNKWKIFKNAPTLS